MRKRIIIEIDGYRMEIPGDQIDNLTMSTPGDVIEVACDCTPGDCGYIHRAYTGPWHLELTADLNSQPLWKVAI